MSITRPTGSYARQMLDPGGWVEADEDTFYDRAQEYSQVLQRVTDVLDTCRQQKGHVFEGGLWSGGAANAANGALGANINQLMTLQDYLATVITWHRHIAGLIEQAKSDIGNNVDGAQREIDILENDPSLDADERHTAINSLVTATHGGPMSVWSPRPLSGCWNPRIGNLRRTHSRICFSRSRRHPQTCLPWSCHPRAHRAHREPRSRREPRSPREPQSHPSRERR